MPQTEPSLQTVLPALVRERLLAGDDAVEVGRALVAAGTAALAGALGARIAYPVAMLVVADAAEVASGE